MTYLKERLLSINDNNIARFTMDIQLSDNITRTKEGYLRCENVTMGRTGYQQYMGSELTGMGFNATEIVEVFRDEKEVFHEDTLNSAIGKPVTLGHPDEDVDINNIKELGKGYILGRPKRVGDDMVGDILITDIDLIDAVWNKRLRELSLGYQTKLVKDDNGVKQTEIYINHLAVVENGRAGNAMIIDEQTIKKGGNDLDLDKLREQGIHIHINLGDEEIYRRQTKTVETEPDWNDPTKIRKTTYTHLEVIEKIDKDGIKTLYTLDEDGKERLLTDEELKVINDENKVDNDLNDKGDVGDGAEEQTPPQTNEKTPENKTNEKENLKDMDITKLLAGINELSPEDQAKLRDSLGIKVDTKDAKPEVNAFDEVTQVDNLVDSKADLKDYSGVSGNEMSDALQKYHDDNFSFRAIRTKSGDSSLKARNVLFNAKDKEERMFIKTGGNK